MEPGSIFVQGSGGHVIKMDLPLHEATEGQLTKGYLRRVNEDGSPYAEPVEDQGDGQPPAPTVVERPAPSALKPEWVGYAVRHPDEARRMTPDEAEALTKADLIERFGKD